MTKGADLSSIDVDNDREIELFNFYADKHCEPIRLGHAVPTEHEVRQANWRYPELFETLDLDAFFEQACTTDEQRERVAYELTLYREYKVERLLRWAIWFMTFVETNDVFVGVGRGSSVSSYCLYIIGLHMVDSIAYGLDPKEFLK